MKSKEQIRDERKDKSREQLRTERMEYRTCCRMVLGKVRKEIATAVRIHRACKKIDH